MKGVRFTPKNYSDEVEAKIQHYKKEGYKLPMRSALRTEEQLAGIRASAKINTALLDYLSENIRRLPQKCVHQHQRCSVPRHSQHQGIPEKR